MLIFLLLLIPYFGMAQITFGTHFSYFHLNGDRSTKGLLEGVNLEIDYSPPNSIYFGLRSQLNFGHLSGYTPYGLKTSNLALEKIIEGKFGKNFSSHSLLWTPYTGFAFYYLDEKWDEAYNIARFRIYSLPLGVLIQKGRLSCLLQLNLMLSGRWKMEGHPSLPDCENKLENKLFYLIEIPYSFQSKPIDIRFVPFARFGTLSRGKIENIHFDPIHLTSIGGRLELGLDY